MNISEADQDKLNSDFFSVWKDIFWKSVVQNGILGYALMGGLGCVGNK